MGLENIKISENRKIESDFDYQKTFDSCIIDLDKPIEQPPIVMGIGYSDYKGQSYLNPTFTKGEMSAIIAPQKSKKTFFKTALASCYIGGNSSHYFPNIKSTRKSDEDLYVLDFDTEQGQYYTQRAGNRVQEMVGAKYPNYLAFGTKKLSDVDRVNLIDAIVNDPKYKGKIGIIFIDGVADLCENTNDIERSKAVIEKVMKWNEGTHICNVIHKTFDKDKATGHLGSTIQKKCETSIFLRVTDKDNKNSPVEVKQVDSRGAPFDTFYFDLDLHNVLPKECKNEWM